MQGTAPLRQRQRLKAIAPSQVPRIPSTKIALPFEGFENLAQMGDIRPVQRFFGISAISVSGNRMKGGHSLPDRKVVE
jgi:hypothetical protein